MGVKGLYLAAYNAVQAVGWGIVFVRLFSGLFAQFQKVSKAHNGDFVASLTACDEYDFQALWDDVGETLVLFQNLAAMEILHSLVGLVRSPFVTTFAQVLSRLLLVNLTAHFASVQNEWAMALMVGSWATIEIVRYGFFALKEAGLSVPFALTWLRYSLFFVLYPSGVSGEVLTFWNSKPEFEKIAAANSVNIAGFQLTVMHFFWLVLVLYLPGLPVMYTHMIKQRKRTLYGSQKVKTN